MTGLSEENFKGLTSNWGRQIARSDHAYFGAAMLILDTCSKLISIDA